MNLGRMNPFSELAAPVKPNGEEIGTEEGDIRTSLIIIGMSLGSGRNNCTTKTD